ncbi:hypothetical protein EBT16_11410 [bacterium]|nr:hypothetical protein [bacterium]
MNCAVLVQTCDKYQPFWDGFFHFMEKQWDFGTGCPIYFCNEKKKLDLPRGFTQIRTGSGSFVQNLKVALDEISQEHVFYMLEDFWPTAPMSRERFVSLYESFVKNEMDALQVSTYTPYYKLVVDEMSACGNKLLRFESDSEWIFNFQARFWKKALLSQCLREPKISESAVSSAITVEMESDEYTRKEMNLKVWLHHYFWYPITGVAYRGNLTEIGKQMQNVVEIEKFVEEKFNLRFASDLQ